MSPSSARIFLMLGVSSKSSSNRFKILCFQGLNYYQYIVLQLIKCFLSIRILFFPAFMKSLCSGNVIMVRSVKSFPKDNISNFFICDKILNDCAWYVITKWKSSGFSFISWTKAFTVESINCLYSSTLSLVGIDTRRSLVDHQQ